MMERATAGRKDLPMTQIGGTVSNRTEDIVMLNVCEGLSLQMSAMQVIWQAGVCTRVHIS
jgi:hypothetical protein